TACPAGVDIPRYIRAMRAGDLDAAAAVLREKLSFPLVLGIICHRPCELQCRRRFLGGAVSIREIKRAAIMRDSCAWTRRLPSPPVTGRRVAIVGGGPCGLTAGYCLMRKGHAVRVFEQFDRAGGMLLHAIPAWRLPGTVVERELGILTDAGLQIETGRRIGNTAALREEYDAVLVAAGAWRGRRLEALEGHDAENAFSALELLQAARQEGRLPEGRRFNVIGGGSVAFDAARTLARAGRSVTLIALERLDALPAGREELLAARAEGVTVLSSAHTLRLLTDGHRVCGQEILSIDGFSLEGGLTFTPLAGTERVLPCDGLVFAAGQAGHLSADFGLPLNASGWPEADPLTGKTPLSGVFAAGDALYGTRSVVEAVAAGRAAARQIDLYIGGDGSIDEPLLPGPPREARLEGIEGFSALERRTGALDAEAARAESLRCLQCDLRCDIRPVPLWTADGEAK
ncbi:MAG: FAD-dependent oxidoreductase, partial [Clostridia bacterium]|nr:FAD-dependent oxidoreductase [Clostridia bacterium]